MSEETTTTPPSQIWAIGTKVQKYFPGYGVFMGKVTRFDDGLYHIAYSDGDEEDFDEKDMERHVFLYNDPCLTLVPVVTPPPLALPYESFDRKRAGNVTMDTEEAGRPKRMKFDSAVNIGIQGTTAADVPSVTLPSVSASLNLLHQAEIESSLFSFDALYDENTPVHTLIVGTFPASDSLNQRRYFSNPCNAFWWIAGDCLGFRRDKGELKNRDGYLGFCQYLEYDESYCIPYQEQVNRFCRKGFALWDVLASCKRSNGSRDSDIERGTAKPNDLRRFVMEHPTIKRIVFASGKSTARYFNEYFKDWWNSGELVYYGDHHFSAEAFQHMLRVDAPNPDPDAVVCICAKSVSPSDANTSYIEKRKFWKDHVYNPGLELHDALTSLEDSSKGESPTTVIEL